MLSPRVTRRFFVFLGALAAPLLFAAACNIDVGVGGNNPPCASHADCGPGGLCLIDGTCSAACAPSPEVCDGIDNDGDGVVDEVCQGGCMTDAECPPGHGCINGACSPLGQGGATQCLPAPEVCDGIDNDCNGIVDENCGPPCNADGTCPAGYQCVNGVCQSGPCDPNGNCPPCMIDTDCPPGYECVNGMCYAGQCNPTPEICDMVDNDCNGIIDDNCLPCDASGNCPPCMIDADCPAGYECVNGMCYAGQCNPAPEVCDGIDNDCNGAVDEICPPCMTDAECPPGYLCSASYVCIEGMP